MSSPPAVQSYDVFDTLMARLRFEPRTVFEDVARRVPEMPNFVDLRCRAESQADGTFDGIYRRFAEVAGVPREEAARIQALEFEAERRALFPIAENLRRVRDGDVLVSDMYLPGERIVELLNGCGLDKAVRIFVSPGGKSSGWIWGNVLREFRVECHTGDNHHSDVTMPLQHGVPRTVHSTIHNFTPDEEAVARFQNARDLALLMRYVRLQCPHEPGSPEHAVWSVCARLTLPFVLIASMHADYYARCHDIQVLAFPDAPVPWADLHEALFPPGSRGWPRVHKGPVTGAEDVWRLPPRHRRHADRWVEAFGPFDLALKGPDAPEAAREVQATHAAYAGVAAEATRLAIKGALLLEIPDGADDAPAHWHGMQIRDIHEHFVAVCNA